MPSGTEHKVAIVDFSSGNFEATYVKFSDKEFTNKAPHGRYRRVEWAVDTDYVWTNDSTNDEVYVIDVIKGELVNTIPNESSAFLSVQNWARVRETTMHNELLDKFAALEERETTMHNELLDQMAASGKDSDSGPSATAALAVGIVALVLGLINLVMICSKPRQQAVLAVPDEVAKRNPRGDEASEGGDEKASVASESLRSAV